MAMPPRRKEPGHHPVDADIQEREPTAHHFRLDQGEHARNQLAGRQRNGKRDEGGPIQTLRQRPDRQDQRRQPGEPGPMQHAVTRGVHVDAQMCHASASVPQSRADVAAADARNRCARGRRCDYERGAPQSLGFISLARSCRNLKPSRDCTARVNLLFVSTVWFVSHEVASTATGEISVKTDRAERRQVGDRRQSAFPDLHERLENKRLAIDHERRRVTRREADRSAVPCARRPTP